MSDSVTAEPAAPADGGNQGVSSGDRGPVAALDREGRLRRLARSVAVAWVVALLAVAAAIWFALQAQELRAQEAARTQALEAGEVTALQITTFTGAGIDQWVEQTKTLATGAFAQDLTQQYDQQLRADLREANVESVGEIINSFVQDMKGDEALVFAVLRQTTRYPTYNRTVEDEVRFEITLQRQGDRWLTSDAKLLSPTPPLQPRPFLEDQGGNG